MKHVLPMFLRPTYAYPYPDPGLYDLDFVNGIDTEQLSNPSVSLRIETFDSGTIKVDGYMDVAQPFIVSNLNPSSCFDPTTGNLIKKLFVGKGSFQGLP